jgi:hypothetical protein
MRPLTALKRHGIDSRVFKSSPRLWMKRATFSIHAIAAELAFGSQMTYGMRIIGPSEPRQFSYFYRDFKRTNFFVGQPPR